MASGKFTTLFARNEISASLDTEVGCILLSSQDEVVRPLDLPDDWDEVIIFWEDTMVDAPSTGNLSGFHFAGLCSEGRSFTSSLNAHCVGWSTGNSATTSDGNWTATTSPNTDPINQNIMWNATTWVTTFITGSIDTHQFAGAGQGQYFGRYDVEFSSSYASASIAGNAWCPRFVKINRKYHASYNADYTHYFVGWRHWDTPYVGIDKDVFFQGLNSAWGVLSQTQMQVWDQYYKEIGSNFDGVTGLLNDSGFWCRDPMNEDVYGKLNRINFFWRANAANPAAKWAIRNITVVVTSRGATS